MYAGYLDSMASQVWNSLVTFLLLLSFADEASVSPQLSHLGRRTSDANSALYTTISISESIEQIDRRCCNGMP